MQAGAGKERCAGVRRQARTHEAGGVGLVSARLAVNLDESLHKDVLDLLGVEGVLEAVAQQDDQRHALAKLVRARRRPWGPDTAQLVEHPVLRRIEALEMALRTARHGLTGEGAGKRASVSEGQAWRCASEPRAGWAAAASRGARRTARGEGHEARSRCQRKQVVGTNLCGRTFRPILL